MTHALLFSICPPFCSALIRVNPPPISSAATIAKLLVGNYREEHLFALGQAVSLYETYQAKIAECEAAIGRYLGSQPNRTDQEPPPEDKSVRNRDRLRGGVDVRSQLYKMTGADLFSLPGLATDTLLTLAGEVGFDMTPWRSEKDFTSWLALCPGTRIQPIQGRL